MQLTLQLPPDAYSDVDSGMLEASSSNISSSSSSPTWTTASFEAGPSTPAAKCGPLQRGAFTADASTNSQHQRSVYKSLQLTLPCSPSWQTDSCCGPTARRVLHTSGPYSDVCQWLDQQVTRRMGSKGQLIAACSHISLELDPALEPPVTPAQSDASESLPAPAFQLLGLL